MYALNLNVNLVDVLMLCIIIRGCYVGAKSGLPAEVFRLLSVVCVTFIVVHYYSPLAQFLHEKLFISEKTSEFAAFVIWMLAAFLVFFLIREGWLVLVKSEPKAAVHHWAAAAGSLVTSYFVCGLVFLALALSNNGDVQQQLQRSISRLVWSRTAGNLYNVSYGALVRPFFPDEKPNQRISRLMNEPAQE